MVKKGQKNLNYSNILDAPSGNLPLYKKEVEFVLEVILMVSLLSTEVVFCTLNGYLTWVWAGNCVMNVENCSPS